MKPIIGVVGRPEKLSSGSEIYYINREINEAIVKNGGVTITINPNIIESLIDKDITNTSKLTNEQLEELKRLIDLCDGIVCQGGDEYYDYDLKIIDYCYKKDKPLLGICLGMQTMSCLFNGEMNELGHLNHKNNNKYVHNIKIDQTSRFYGIINKEYIKVNSRHKCFITKTDLDIVGVSDDNIIEAVEDKNRKFFIGVQWHPESMIEYDILENNLFSYFINCCRR